MAPRLSKRESDALDKFLYNNLQVDSHEVTALYSITHGIINKRKAIICRIALISVNNWSKGNCLKIVTLEILEYAIALIARDSTLYLDEVADYLFMEFGIQLDISQVSRLWKQAGVSHKKLSVQAR